MPYCALRTCKAHSRNLNKSQGVTFHKFPKVGTEEREVWTRFVQINRRDETWQPGPYANICNAHFQESDFYVTKSGRFYLHKDAIPYGDYDPGPFLVGLPVTVSGELSESYHDGFQKIVLKRRLSEEAPEAVEKKTKIEPEEKYKKWESYKSIVKSLKEEFGFGLKIENDLMSKANLLDFHNLVVTKNVFLSSPPLRRFAVSLHYYSPAMYEYVKETYKKALPNIKTARGWYSKFNAEPGFTVEIFKLLKQTYQMNSKPLLCSLVFKEIKIKKKKLFLDDRKLGFVNFGAGPVDGEKEDIIATQALVFLLVSLNENWKLPVGYFLLSDINAEKKANLINVCLEKCHDAGVTVVSLTFDGFSVNFRAAELLGCELSDINSLKTHFPHPVTSENVCIFIDPTHVVKLIRDGFETRKLIFDESNDKVNWQYLVNLNKLQQNGSLEFVNILTPQGIYLRDRLMKVKLSTELFSMTLGNTLQLCDDVLQSNQFKNSSATVNFITVINNFFKIMSSRKCESYGIKRPLDKENKADIFSYLNVIKSYILQLQYQCKLRMNYKKQRNRPQIAIKITNKHLVESSNKAGFVGAIICIESMITLYEYLVEEEKVIEHIAMHRMSLDHLEMLFGSIRKHSGKNNDPNVLQFKATYKEMLNHLDLRTSIGDNCFPLDNYPILNSASVNVINNTSDLYRHDEEIYQVLRANKPLQSDLEAEKNCEIFSNILDQENVAQASRLIVGYISGYVARILTTKIKCEECVDSLTTTIKLPHHKLITIKDMGGLCYSSKDVYKICCCAETVIRHLKKQSGSKVVSSISAPTHITFHTLKGFIDIDIFACLIQHALNQPPLFNHRIQLIRAVVEKYTTIRLKNDTNISNNTCSSQKLTKLILFDRKI